MTDREMLELAALAAGNEVWTDCDGNLYTGDPERAWNPLASDGDALRLAVKLQLTVCNEHVSAGAAYCMRGDDAFPFISSGSNEDHVIDSDYPATRRAITRAAAVIGQQMKEGKS